jgi:hypothetical protein
MLSSLRAVLRFGARILYLRRKLIFESSVNEGEPVVAAMPVTFRFGNERDLLALDKHEHGYSDEARAFGLGRLKMGDRLVICEGDAGVVFYAWVMFNQMDLSCRAYLPLSPSRAYTYKLFTVARYRGRRICPAYYTFIKGELKKRGIRHVVAWVEAGNRESIRAHLRSGFHEVGMIWHVQFLFRSYFGVNHRTRDFLLQTPPAVNATPGTGPLRCDY